MIRASKGRIIKAYMCDDILDKPVHAIIDEFGYVFFKGCGGWSIQTKYDALIALPNEVKRGNDSICVGWSWDDWWEKNWQCDSWAWVYGKAIAV